MIYRETVWRDERVSIVEVIPLAGQDVPPNFRRFHFRSSMQAILSSGPVIKTVDVPLRAENLIAAMDEGAAMKDEQERKLSNELVAEVNRMMVEETNLLSSRMTMPSVPVLEEEEQKVSAK